MDDDFNTANAIAVLFEITRDINTLLQNESVSAAVLQTLLGFYDERSACSASAARSSRRTATPRSKRLSRSARRRKRKKTIKKRTKSARVWEKWA